MAKEKLAVDIVLEDVTCSTRFIRLALARGCKASGSRVRAKHFVSGWDACAAFFDWTSVDLHAVDVLQEVFGDALRNETRGADEFTLLVNRENAVDDEFGFCSREVGEDETRTVAQHDFGREVQRLEVLGFTGRRGDRDLFRSEESVDCT